LWPDKSAAFKSLLKQTQTIAIEPKQLDQVAALAAKDEDMS
jgi:hypothetical protein